jgi:hypothetical protein
MNFNWSKNKQVNLLFSENIEDKGLFIKKSDVAKSWENYLSIYDENKCLKSQHIKHHHLLQFSKNDIVNYTPDSSLILEFANTEFSLDGILQFAEKYGRLGISQSFDLPNSYLEVANTWLWELSNVRNVLSLIKFKQDLSIDKFSPLLKIDLSTGLWEFENDRYKTADINFPIYILPTGNFELGYEKELIRFKEELNKENLQKVIDDILLIIFFNFYRDRVKPIVSINNKFSSEIQPTSLIGYIWHQLFKIVENNNSIKHCLYCKEVFIIGSGSARSDKVYCSNSCVVNGSRTEAIFKKYEKDFQKKGYLIRKSGGNTENQFDYWLINKENVLIAGLDIAQSQISEFSQKWGHQCKMIETKLNANNLSIAFLINKEGRKYSFSNLSTIMGSFIENIPDISFWDEHLKMFSVLSKYKKDFEEQKKVSMELQKIKESFFSDLQEDLTIPELKDDIKNNKEVA